MSEKPSYEDLEQRVKELEETAATYKDNEELYRTALEQAGTGVAVITGDTFLYANDALARLFGYDRPEEIVEKPFSLFLHQDDLKEMIHFDHPGPEGGSARPQYESRVICRDGSSIDLSISASSTIYDGKPASILLLRNVAEEKQPEKSPDQSEAKYRNIFENIKDIYFETSVEGILLEVSPSIENLFGYQRERVIGTSLYDLYFNPSDRDAVIEELLKRGKIKDHEISMKDANGARTYCLSTAALIRDDQNNPLKIVGSLRNISERKKTEIALQESEAQKIAILDASIDRIRYVDKDMRVIWANKAAASGLEMSADDLKGRRCYELFIERDVPCEGCPTVKAIETGQIERAVMHQPRLKGVDGESYWDAYCVPVRNRAGEVVSYLQVSRNVTEQKQTALELHEKEETLKAILAASPVGVGLARDRIISWANKAMYDLLGYREGDEDSLTGRTTRLFYPDDEEYHRAGQELYSKVKKGGLGRIDTKWVKKDGSVVDCYVQATLLDPGDPAKGVIVAGLDITKRKEAEERIHSLTHELIRVQENERQIISRELHDRVAQDLSTAKIIADQILLSQAETPTPEVRRKISAITSVLQAAINTVRNLAYDLRPPVLDDMGLIQAIFQYCGEFSERTGLAIDFSSAGLDNATLDSNTEINLYRLIQEALNNIHRHAEARCATVKLVRAFPNILLRIEDDGKGFDVDARRVASTGEKRMGLQSMEERVHLLEGRMELQSRLMQGTKIIIRIPVKETEHDPQENRGDCG